MPAPEPKKPDPLVLLARASAAKRKRPVLPLVLILGALLLGTGVFVWWVWPGSAATALTIALFDQVALPDVPVRLSARVEPLDPTDVPANLADCELHFVELSGIEAPKAVTSANGVAHIERAFPAGAVVVEMLVRYPGIPDRRRGASSPGRVFVWPADAALLFVDVDHALAKVGTDDLWAANPLEAELQEGAAAALRATRKKYHAVYLSAGADRPSRYNRLRGWLGRRGDKGQELLPDGPVFCPAGSGGDEGLHFPQAVIGELTGRFHGSAAGVTGNVAVARAFHEAGLRTFLLSTADDVPEGVTVVGSWKELVKRLAE